MPSAAAPVAAGRQPGAGGAGRPTRTSAFGPAALAAVGGALYALGFVGFGLWPLALAAWAPLWGALELARTRGPGASALAGLSFGAAAYVLGYGWLWHLVDGFLGGNVALGALLHGLHGAWFAAGFALQALLYRAARRRGWPVALAGVAALVATEWLYPALFPLRLGNALVERTLWIQSADLGGPLLLSALVGLANAALFEGWRFARATRRARGGREPDPRAARRPLAGTLAATALAALAAAAYGAARTADVERAVAAAPSLRVGLVQANADALAKRRDPEAVYQAHLARTRALLAETTVDLVVWPETVYSRGIAGPLPVSGELVRGGLPVPLLFGAASVRTVGERRLTFNSALLVGADGSIRTGYDKNLLVPFAESAPLPALAPLFPHAQRFGAGSATSPLLLGPWRIATPICFEAVEPAYVRRMVAEGRPHLLVTLANDGWFGDSQEPLLHLAVARLRAVEHRRALVRATNSGISAVVDPLGRVTARSRLHAAETLVARAPLLDGPPTVYGRAGDWPGALAAGVLGLMLALPRPRAGGGPLAPR